MTSLLAAAVVVLASELLVTSRNTDEVLRYDLATGAFLGVFAAGGGLDNPVGLTFGPDGHLYVASDVTDQVLRYDLDTAK
jgi:glucose/arabinose dehydrogenase